MSIMSLKERLEQFAQEMKDWETRKTSIMGVEIAKLPSKEGELNLALKIIPTDEEGKPLKRKGVFITSLEQWDSMKRIFNDEKATELIENIEKMRQKREIKEDKEDTGEVFEL
ncbi:MAG: hypothetical protein K9W45_07585 [Candidatus Heimdallarchaeum aukensis]|uniref:Uncharacterized protein n=1 Tax=Candidatus Heimdallarchaeum aukensis TaxID=2876573 RepID=A0A9Y1BJ12_9ARCH|nr:MAG: hypothetical protein K9W45_07585 [Candidatus Heimdallarchaeum aukensis]